MYESNVVNILKVLNELEVELKELGYWTEERPSAEAFQSTTPFFLDTMKLHTWLQFVLIERFRAIVEEGKYLPTNLSIFPYAFEFYKDEKDRHMKLLKLIHKLDSYFK